MATRQYISTGSEDIALLSGTDVSTSTVLLQIEGSGWSGSLAVKKRVMGAPAWYLLPFIRMQDGASVTGSINTNGIYMVDSAGCDIELTHSYASGIVYIYLKQVIG